MVWHPVRQVWLGQKWLSQMWRSYAGWVISHQTPARRKTAIGQGRIERLESRQLLSASGASEAGSSLPGSAMVAEAETASVHVAERVVRIINGEVTADFPSVGLIGSSRRNNCTGTLISDRWVLTAAHCSTGLAHTDGRFTINGQVYQTELVVIHPQYRPRRFNSNKANDIALWKLAEPVEGVEPSPIYRNVPRIGTLLTLVGFGSGGTYQDGETGDFGTKRVGTTPLEKVTKTRLRWRFDSPSESNTAHGDSGGPAFITEGETLYVAGVTSGGTKYNASKGDRSYDTRVDVYQGWIDDVMSGNLASPLSRREQRLLARRAGPVEEAACGCEAAPA